MTSPWPQPDYVNRLVMCCLCFKPISFDSLSKDEDGFLTDVCLKCSDWEKKTQGGTMIVTTKFQRKTFSIQAIQVTNENMPELARWCNGEMLLKEPAPGTFVKAIAVPTTRSAGKQVKVYAYVGDWVSRLTEANHFRVYREKTFLEAFEEIRSVEQRKAVLGVLEDLEQSSALGHDIKCETYGDRIMAIFEGSK
jgi:hypothetical protein